MIAAELNREGLKTKSRKAWTTASVYRVLNNHTYIGEINYRDSEVFKGVHEAIVSQEVWDRTREILAGNNRIKDPSKRTRKDIPLRGIIRCGHCDCPMMPSYAKKKGVTYYYYLCEKHEKSTGNSPCPVKKVPAGIIEKLVKEQLGKVFGASEVLETLAGKTGLPQEEIKKMFREDFWNEVTPAEFTRLAQLLLDRVTLYDDHIELDIKIENMTSIIEEFAKDEN